ncbi:hypothetical protein H7K38_12330 [Mycobacterium alsense]|uniref:Uncharacterized protein n=1 Tax=Mycobacterium alsense TaxID=324058 RepID=A0AA42BYA1_9MYCO|nr:hypothetical protein [Mycobacterium alsense]MCV7379435.1 hypothetical protein [Mycobacterium alsense]
MARDDALTLVDDVLGYTWLSWRGTATAHQRFHAAMLAVSAGSDGDRRRPQRRLLT